MWTVVASEDEQTWFENYVRLALATTAPSCPPKSSSFGDTTVRWFETEPGVAFISATGGTPDDRVLATQVLRAELQSVGIERAQYTFDREHRTAEWDDIAAKAKRLIQSGNVTLLRNGANNIVGHVVGDHGDYQTEIGRDDPNSRAITTWQCECPWDQYAWQRTRQWKKYEGRPCAHVMATYWTSLMTPLDDQANPQQNQQSLFTMPNGQPGPTPTSPFQAPPVAPQGQQMALPGMMGPNMAVGTPPVQSDPGIIPPFPLDQLQQAQQAVNPASVPGLRQPSPTNPVQYPGGTFSHTSGWFDTMEVVSHANGEMVSTKNDDWGEWQGRSEEHGAGQPAKVPKGSVGEVLGVDPTTGMVNVLFMNQSTGVNQHGPMEPWGITGWFLPSEVVARPDVKRPGPAIKRR